MKFEDLTKEQQAAVKEQGSILVSAAAGSGKTAVLVERIIDELTRSDAPLRADRLLVVTFTNAAAAEMRSRLEKGLEDYCRNNPNDTAAATQKLLLQSAKICTIDAFCIDMVRENFDIADVNFDFRIADNNELERYKNIALENVFERYFESEDRVFIDLLDAFDSVYDEKRLKDAVVEIYRKTDVLPFPNLWYKNAKQSYSESSFEDWKSRAFKYAEDILNNARAHLVYATKVYEFNEDVKNAYGPSVESAIADIDALKQHVIKKDWNGFFGDIQGFTFISLGSLKKGMAGSHDAVKVKELRSSAKDLLKDICNVFYADNITAKEQYMKISPLTTYLLKLSEEFANEFLAVKKEQGVLEFSDIEHIALGMICSADEEGNIVLKDGAQEFISLYDEILVDEYQDVNDLQDIFFHYLSDCGKHLFAVGDVKQSIYGFRGANPYNFMKRRENCVDYTVAKQGEGKKIILGNNFRSKDEICSFINFFFSIFMTEENCSIEYGTQEKLFPKSDYPYTQIPATEAHYIECLDSEDSIKVCEAKHIADYIISVMNSGPVIKDKESGLLRNARYSDFAVIMRSMKGNATVLADELKNRGVPVTYARNDFLESKEIVLALSLLSVISNPTRDIELLTVMMSPLFGFSVEEVAQVRLAKKKCSLYAALIAASENGNSKASYFINKLANLRKYAVIFPLVKLITAVYDDTSLPNIVSLMSEGETRKANLMLLIDHASNFEQSGQKGIEAFLRNLNEIEEGKLSSAAVSSGNNSVKICTFHNSKGLQFPVCILAFLSSVFNTADEKKPLVFDSEGNVAFSYYSVNGGKVTSLPQHIIKLSSHEKMLEEELRLLYVAMTRAEDKLVMMISAKNVAGNVERIGKLMEVYGGKAENTVYKSARSYADWITASLLLHSGATVLRSLSGIELDTLSEQERISVDIYKPNDVSFSEEIVYTDSVDNTLLAAIKEHMKYVYPFDILRTLESKSSVSDIVHKSEAVDYAFTALPSFMGQNGFSPTERGTATHKLMQFIDFGNAEKDLDSELERLTEWEFLSVREAEAINKTHIQRFFESDLYKRIKNASLVKREMKFLTNMPAWRIDKSLPDSVKNENIIVQGAVDCLFVEDGKIVVVDFKTDRVKDAAKLISSYKEQLDIYAEACSKILDLPISEKIIYSLEMDKEIIV